MSDSVSSRILAAATLAEQAAAGATQGDWRADGLYASVVDTSDVLPNRVRIYAGIDNARLIAASGPSHWGAVAAGFRALVAMHDRYWAACSVGEHHCRYGYLACESLNELLPLADRIIRDLGGTENG